jgi:hypothetical protein
MKAAIVSRVQFFSFASLPGMHRNLEPQKNKKPLSLMPIGKISRQEGPNA